MDKITKEQDESKFLGKDKAKNKKELNEFNNLIKEKAELLENLENEKKKNENALNDLDIIKKKRKNY